MSDDEYYSDPYNIDDDWKDEKGAFDRVGTGRTEIEGKGYLQSLERQYAQNRADPDEYIRALIAELRTEIFPLNKKKIQLLPITDGDVEILMDKLSLISRLDYKNPIALIFGFYVYQPDNVVSKSRLKHVNDAMSYEPYEEYFKFVYLYDIIRYVRLWDTVLKV